MVSQELNYLRITQCDIRFLSLSLVLSLLGIGNTIVESSTNVVELSANKWEVSVIGFFLGKQLPFLVVKKCYCQEIS